MWDENTAKELSVAVGELHEALDRSLTFEEAMRVLDLVPLEVLKLIEEEFHYLWTPPSELRARIAYAHLRRVTGRDHANPIPITSRTVTEWAQGTLEEWLPGVANYGADGNQYRIKQMTDGTYQVETIRGYGARRFHVLVTVVEAT